MLEPLECLFDTPALVVQVAERTSRETHHIKQVGHQYEHPAIGRNVVHQADGLRLARAFKAGHIAPLCNGQRGLLGPDAPVRHSAKRRRIKTVMQELIYRSGRLIEHGRQLILILGANDRAAEVFIRMNTHLGSSGIGVT